MRLRQRRSGKVASGKRAARGHWDIRKRKGRPARARGISGVPLPPGARAGRNPIGDTDPVAARCTLATWLPSFRACRREETTTATGWVSQAEPMVQFQHPLVALLN